MAEGKIERLQRKAHKAREHNRALGVIEYDAGVQQKSDAVYEIETGLHKLPDGQVLGPGHRFRPLAGQVRVRRDGRFPLAGKARELTATELSGIRTTRTQVMGADIGLRQLSFTDQAFKLAQENDLDVDDFNGVTPVGANSTYTKAQVQQVIDDILAASNEDEGGNDDDDEDDDDGEDDD